MAEVEDLTGDDGVNGTGPTLEAQLEEMETELGEIRSQIEYLMQRQDELRARKGQLLRQIEQERRAPKADWQQDDFTWSAKLKETMHDVFGLHGFRPLQQEVMNATLQGRDVLCLLPSGGGKSLCYQLPALVSKGLTLVVSPLLSLIQDQILSLRALGISGTALTSLTGKDEVTEVYGKMERGELKLLYVTPEKIVTNKRLMSKLEKVHQAGGLDRIAIDEAHCASQWGNDFRPDYKKLGILKQQFPQVPILALTATATRQVCEDLKSIMRISGCEFFRASVNRPNLFYEVRPKPAAPADATAAIVAWIREHYPRGESGIVYCLTRKDCETVAAELAAGGVTARHYHADMDPVPREAAHAAWSEGTVQVMVATVAFGMGINKPDVRFVVHHSLSKSVENYYQESGRAGRDGLPARCLMFYRFSDALRQAAIVCSEPTWQPNLTAMMAYATAEHACAGAAAGCGEQDGVGGCRRALIQRHFAEAPADCRCMCDNCCAAAGPRLPPPVDASRHALALLAVLRQQQAKEKKTTLLQLVDLWRSSKVGKEAKAMSKEENEAVVAAMMYGGLLEFEFAHSPYMTNTYLKPSAKGNQLLDVSESAGAGPSLKLLIPAPTPAIAASPAANTSKPGSKSAAAAPSSPTGAYGSGADSDAAPDPVLTSLEEWRAHQARALQVFPHSVLSGEQLAALCALGRPATEDALRQALGVRRHELYGKELAEVLGRHGPCEPKPATGNGLVAAAGGGGSGSGGSVEAAGAAAQQDKKKKEKQPREKQAEEKQPKGRQSKGKQPKAQGEAPAEVVVLDDSAEEGVGGDGGEAAEDLCARKKARKSAADGTPKQEKPKAGSKQQRVEEAGQAKASGERGKQQKAGKGPKAASTDSADGSSSGGESDQVGDSDSGDDFAEDVPLSKRRRA